MVNPPFFGWSKSCHLHHIFKYFYPHATPKIFANLEFNINNNTRMQPKKNDGCLRFLEPRYWPLGIIGDHDPKYGWYLRISSNKWTHRRILDFGLCFWPLLCQNEFHLIYSCKQWAGWKKKQPDPPENGRIPLQYFDDLEFYVFCSAPIDWGLFWWVWDQDATLATSIIFRVPTSE